MEVTHTESGTKTTITIFKSMYATYFSVTVVDKLTKITVKLTKVKNQFNENLHDKKRLNKSFSKYTYQE